MSVIDDILQPKVGEGTVLAPPTPKPITFGGQQTEQQAEQPKTPKEGEGTVLAPEPEKPITFQGAIQQAGGVQGSTSPEPVSKPVPETPAEPQRLNYLDMMEKLYPHTTEEDIKKEQKKMKREATMAMLSDGLAAFHKAYSHARGVQPMPNVGGMSEKVRERYDKRMKEFREEKQKYANAYINTQHMEDMLAQTKRRNDYEVQRQDRLDRKAEIEKDIAKARIKQMEAATEKNYAEAAKQRAYADALEAGESRKDALNAAKVAESRARAYQAREAGRLNGVRADAGGYSSSANGVGEYEVTETKKDRRGNIVSQTTKSRKKIGGSQKKANPMGGSGKKSNPMN